jgi:hypothetical protein
MLEKFWKKSFVQLAYAAIALSAADKATISSRVLSEN